MILEALARWLVYLSAVGALGLVGFRWLVSRGASRRPVAPEEQAALLRWGVWCGLALVVAVLFRAVAQTIAVFGFEDLSLASLRTVALESRWADRWLWQLGAATSVLVAHVAARAWRRLLPLAGLTAIAFAWTLPLTGHAYGDLWAWIAQSLHGLGAGLWIGTLLTLAVAARASRAAVAPELAEEREKDRLVAFAPLAVTGAATLIATGAFLAWRALPDLALLWTAPWGRILLLKVGLVGVVLSIGALNHRRLRRSSDLSVALTLRAELLVAVLVLAATGWLSSTSPPEAG